MLGYEDERSEQDIHDLTIHSMKHAEEENPYEDDLIEQEVKVLYKPVALIGDEALISPGLGLHDATVLHFWRWAFSDLRANSLRGIFAEWLVARLLRLDQPVRDPWAAWDLITPEEVTIEVKASAYLQSWSDGRYSKISFSGLRGQTWTLEAGLSGTATYNADLYVFCVQIEKDADMWNVLDLAQWRFYVLPKETLVQRNYKTITLGALASLTQEMTVIEFRERVTKMIQALANARTSERMEVHST